MVKEFEELQRLKKEVMEEKERAERERIEKGEKAEKKGDYLSQLIAIATKVEHHIGVYLPAAYIDAGTIMDHRLGDIYRGYINTIISFLRLFEQVENGVRGVAVKEAIIKLRLVLLEIANNMVKPLLGRFDGHGGYQTTNIDAFKKEWGNRIAEFKDIADRLYDRIDTKSLTI